MLFVNLGDATWLLPSLLCNQRFDRFWYNKTITEKICII